MKRLLTTLLMISVLLVGPPGRAEVLDWDGIISVDTVEVTRGSHFGVKVWLSNNDLAITGMEIPLRFNSPYLSLDSVSFLGTLKPTTFSGVYYQPSGEQSVKISYLPDAFITPLPAFSTSAGQVAELFFTVSSLATAGIIPIDSINHDSILAGNSHWWTRINVADNLGLDTYLPQFVPGAVIVKISTAVDEGENGMLPVDFALGQNYPNPFNPTTTIDIALPQAGYVRLEIFNVLGQKVDSPIESWYPAGIHRVDYDASDHPSGIYFYRLSHNGLTETKKMVLLK